LVAGFSLVRPLGAPLGACLGLLALVWPFLAWSPFGLPWAAIRLGPVGSRFGKPPLGELDVGRVDLDPDPVAAVAFGDEADGTGAEERVEHHTGPDRRAAFATGQEWSAFPDHGVRSGCYN